MNAMFLTDGYKLDHRRMYPEGTEYVYSNGIVNLSTHYHKVFITNNYKN